MKGFAAAPLALLFKIGVSISYLKPETQSLLYSDIILTGHKVKQFQIKELNVLDKCGTVNTETLKTLFQNTEKKILSLKY